MRLIYTFLILLLALIEPTTAKVKVVASTSDLAYYAREIGGDLVDVESIASPTSDPHFVEVRPSYMLKVKKADVVFKVGLELDLWMDKIIDGSRNSKLTVVDCSKYIKPLEVPSFKADARYGDLHRFGNPHYWLGPTNVEPIARAVLEGLSDVDPDNATVYETNGKSFLERIGSGMEKLQTEILDLRNKEIVFYHNSWPYFTQFTGLITQDFVEPYPGVAPSPSHVKELTDLVRSQEIKIIAVEPYFDKRVPEKIASASGAKVVTLYPSIGGRNKSETYLDWMEGNIKALKEALK